MDKLQAMKTFVRVVEAGSFSAVAHEADTTQSAVSKQVAALERELGARLLTRTTRSLALTEEGEHYFEQARRLVAEIAEAEGALRRGEQQLTGWLRIAASVGFGRLKLMPLVQSFLAEHRGVKIDLRLSDGFVDLVEQGIDVAVRLGDLPDSSLIARRVGTAQRMLMAHRSYVRSLPKGTKAPRVPDDLVEHNCIVYTELDAQRVAFYGRAWRDGSGGNHAHRAGRRQSANQQQRSHASLGARGYGDRLFADVAVR
ncbi:LysR family transcriptional regulator [Paraburkholderia nemoris]|uniref:LysR family transcriptional regulator n=1 Tax=Paraburkholderia nemoris TaxID=2793076 RepID=UPI0038BA6BC9